MIETKLFQSGNSQAVRLPKEFERVKGLKIDNWANDIA